MCVFELRFIINMRNEMKKISGHFYIEEELKLNYSNGACKTILGGAICAFFAFPQDLIRAEGGIRLGYLS